jgi:transposase
VRPRLSEAQFVRLERELAKGPAAHGWEDQRWTLERIKTVIGRRFHVSHTIQGVAKLLRRHGWLYDTAFTNPEHLIRTVRHGLRKIQYRSHLIDGCLAVTGLTLAPR